MFELMKVNGNICVGYTFSVFGCIYSNPIMSLVVAQYQDGPGQSKEPTAKTPNSRLQNRSQQQQCDIRETTSTAACYIL